MVPWPVQRDEVDNLVGEEVEAEREIVVEHPNISVEEQRLGTKHLDDDNLAMRQC